MRAFLAWFAGGDDDLVIRAGIALLWFVTINPFEDWNGRIGRAICDMALARADGMKDLFYGLSVIPDIFFIKLFNGLKCVLKNFFLHFLSGFAGDF